MFLPLMTNGLFQAPKCENLRRAGVLAPNMVSIAHLLCNQNKSAGVLPSRTDSFSPSIFCVSSLFWRPVAMDKYRDGFFGVCRVHFLLPDGQQKLDKIGQG